MDQRINAMIEKIIKKPITPFQRELVKVAIMFSIGLVLGIFSAIKSGMSSEIIIYTLYPVGFYYGWRTLFRMLKGNTTNSAETGIITSFFSGSGYMGFVFGILQFTMIFLLAIIVGWIAGYINLIRILLLYKSEEKVHS